MAWVQKLEEPADGSAINEPKGKFWPLKLLRRVTEFQNPRQEKALLWFFFLFFLFFLVKFQIFSALSLLCSATEIEILGFPQNCDYPKLEINNLGIYIRTYSFRSSEIQTPQLFLYLENDYVVPVLCCIFGNSNVLLSTYGVWYFGINSSTETALS